jgi:DNA-binding NarL/FixJ family response regulator
MFACFHHLNREIEHMTKPKMIVVWGSGDILNSSIDLFLAGREDWKVVSVSNKDDLDALILAAENTQPDIVIIHQGCYSNPPDLPLQFLQAHPAIKVIKISLENNAMEVYSKQKIIVKQASDLIKVIENGD